MKIQELYEGKYPTTITASQLVSLVQKIHSREQDFDEGNLTDRIYQFGTYHKKKMKVAELSSDYQINDQMVEQYMAMDPKTMPPIVWDPVNKDMIDGTHRLEALKKKNVKTIEVYVGDESAYEPIQYDDDE